MKFIDEVFLFYCLLVNIMKLAKKINFVSSPSQVFSVSQTLTANTRVQELDFHAQKCVKVTLPFTAE